MREGKAGEVIRELRPSHYIKNIIILIPLIFSMRLLEFELYPRVLLIFLAFCAASSAVYVINDLADRERDALHPTKRHRPIASGRISVRTATVMGIICVLAASALSFAVTLMGGTGAMYAALAYILINIIYSHLLKHIPILDVFCIAMGFMLRVAAGAVAIDVPLSNWLLLTFTALSFYLGFGKRRNELRFVETGDAETRKVLKEYSIGFLDKAMYSMLTLSIAFYALWSIDEDTIARTGTDKLIYTTIIVIVAAFYYALYAEKDDYGDPTTIILKSRVIQALILLYVIAVVFLIYFF